MKGSFINLLHGNLQVRRIVPANSLQFIIMLPP
jgi:hypothetical protein